MYEAVPGGLPALKKQLEYHRVQLIDKSKYAKAEIDNNPDNDSGVDLTGRGK